MRSHPARGAWIEILQRIILKEKVQRRTPQGVRGLKYRAKDIPGAAVESHPARGAWIEIGAADGRAHAHAVAPRKGRVD